MVAPLTEEEKRRITHQELLFIPMAMSVQSSSRTLAEKARRAAEIARGWEPTGTFPFVRLPKELRDCIYDYAFGALPTIFKAGGLLTQATRKVRNSNAKNGDDKVLSHDARLNYHKQIPAFAQGLPRWLLVSKQICSEALSYFGQLHTFCAINERHLRKLQKYLNLVPGSPCLITPLVFNSDVLRNITITREMYESLQIEQDFLALLVRLDVKVLSLELECCIIRTDIKDDWKEHLNDCVAEWEDWEEHLNDWVAEWNAEKWVGNLRSVTITIPIPIPKLKGWDEQIISTARIKQIEALARKFVGNNGTVTWGNFYYESWGWFELSEVEIKIYRRSVVACRKD
jgi:hypothetical protein